MDTVRPLPRASVPQVPCPFCSWMSLLGPPHCPPPTLPAQRAPLLACPLSSPDQRQRGNSPKVMWLVAEVGFTRSGCPTPTVPSTWKGSPCSSPGMQEDLETRSLLRSLPSLAPPSSSALYASLFPAPVTPKETGLFRGLSPPSRFPGNPRVRNRVPPISVSQRAGPGWGRNPVDAY